MVLRTLALATVAMLAAMSVVAQTTFEVASIKRNQSNDVQVVGGDWVPGGRYVATNVNVHELVRQAYDLQSSQIVGGPDWIRSARFDINAKATSEPTPDERRDMLKDLLTSRFRLVAHPERRSLPVYALVLATSGKLGPQMKLADAAQCGPGIADPRPQAGAPLPCGRTMFEPGRLIGRAMTMERLAKLLSNLSSMTGVERMVIDRTGLAGSFDLDLQFSMSVEAASSSSPFVIRAPTSDQRPSLFTALREQLGLRLDPERASVEVLVIDRVEAPTEN